METLLNSKLINFINFQKFYLKEERLESIGNYYQLTNNSLKLYIKNNSKISKNEFYFYYTNLSDHFSLTLDFKYYHTNLIKMSSLKMIEFFELS